MGDRNHSWRKSPQHRQVDPPKALVARSLNGDVGDRLANYTSDDQGPPPNGATCSPHVHEVKADVEKTAAPNLNKSWPCSPTTETSTRAVAEKSISSKHGHPHVGNGDQGAMIYGEEEDEISDMPSSPLITHKETPHQSDSPNTSTESNNELKTNQAVLSSPRHRNKTVQLRFSEDTNTSSDSKKLPSDHEPVRYREKKKASEDLLHASQAMNRTRRLSAGDDEQELGHSSGGNKSPGSQSVASLASNTTFLSHADGILRSSQRHTLGEILRHIETKSKSLLERKDFTGPEPLPDLTFLAHQSRYNSDHNVKRRLMSKMAQCQVVEIFLAVFKSVQTVDYMVEPPELVPSSHAPNLDPPTSQPSPLNTPHPPLPANLTSPNKAQQSQSFGVGYEECRSLANEKLHNVPPSMKNVRAALTLLVNAVSANASVCRQCIDHGVPPLLLSQLTHPHLADSLRSQNRMYLVKGYLSILLSVLKQHPEQKENLKAQAIPALQPYLRCGLLMVKTRALLLLSYLVSERDTVSDRLLAFLVRMLSAALDDRNHQAVKYGVTAVEIASAINRYAYVEANKDVFYVRGVVPLYTRMLHPRCQEEEQMLAAKGIWSLAFSPNNRAQMMQDRACMQALEYLEGNSPREEISKTASGALFVIKGHHLLSPTVESVPEEPHVLISYQWLARSLVFKVKERLIAQGYKVCTDVQNVDIPIMDGMCETVQHAAVVLLCLTHNYKESPSCRTEAEYASATNKDVLGLILEPDYSPDGWLKQVLERAQVFDFSSEEALGSSLPQLVRELGPRARISCPSSYEVLMQSSSSSLRRGQDVSCQTDGSGYVQLYSWTTEDVQRWLKKADLAAVTDKLKHVDGTLLYQLMKIRATAPESFHTMCKTELKLNLQMWLRFNHALDRLGV